MEAMSEGKELQKYDLKIGDAYTVVSTDNRWWTVGKTYPVEFYRGSPMLCDDDGDYQSATLSTLFVPASGSQTEPVEDDVVNRPSHYTRWTIEPVEFLLRNGVEGHTFNIVKYAMRAGFKLYPGKDETESEIIDLEKVRRYAEMRINLLKGEETL